MRILFSLTFVFSFFFVFGQKNKPTLYVVFERNFKNIEALENAFDSLLIKERIAKKYNIKLYFGGSRLWKPERLLEMGVDFNLLKNFCNVCDSINYWNISDDYSFQISDALNTCKIFSGLNIDLINDKLKENLKNTKQINCLLYSPADRSTIEFKNFPNSVEKSSEVNFDVKLIASGDIKAKIGLQVANDHRWDIQEQKSVDLEFLTLNNFIYDLESDTKFCIEYEEIGECSVEKCSDVVEYKYKNKIQPIAVFTDYKFEDIVTNISENEPVVDFNCGADFEIMPESDDYYYFIFKKQKGIKSISIKMIDLCEHESLKDCPGVYLDLIHDPAFEVSHKGYTRYRIHRNEFNPGDANPLTCADLWYYKIDVNVQPLREWEVTFIPEIDENSEFISKEFTKLKLIFKTCGGH